MKVVLDTNVLFSAFAARGLCEALLQACFESCQIALSEHILGELREHLTRKLGVSPTHAESVIDLLRNQAEIVVPTDVPAEACPDRDDLPVLGTAASARADFLITGDKELLSLKACGGCRIVSPREFYGHLQS